MPAEYLRTRNVLLRHCLHEDRDRMLELNGDPDVMRFLSDGRPSTREEIEATFARIRELQERHGGRMGVYSAERARDREYMGWFLLRPDKTDPGNTKELELGYRLKKAFWGHGYATEASGALIRKAFEELGADRVFARAHVDNLGSRRVLEKCGLRFEREYPNPDHPRLATAAIYGLARKDWAPGT